jgi:hypothetical protein
MTKAATTPPQARTSKHSRPPGPRPAERRAMFELSRLMVVALKASSGQLVAKGQTKPNGSWEAEWAPIDTSQTYGVMAAGRTGDGRVAVIAQPSSPTGLFYIDEVPNAIGTEEWNAPIDLGKPPGVLAFLHLAMALDIGARLELFGTDMVGRVWWKYQNPSRIVRKSVTRTPPGTKDPITITVDEIEPPATPWSDWIQIPGGLGPIRASRNADGRIALFGINGAGMLFRNEQRTAQALEEADWAGWVRMDDAATGPFVAMAPALDASGALNLFALNQAGQVLHARQSPPNGSTWTGWSSPGYIRQGVQALSAGLDADGHFVLVAADVSKLYNMNVQRKVDTQQWTGWNPFQTTDSPVELALDYNADGRLTLFSHGLLPRGLFGALGCISQMAPNSTEWELSWTQLASGDIRQYAVVRDLTPPSA